MSTTKLQQIEVKKIVISSDSKRRIDEKSESFLELVASIKAGGLRIPVHVRQVNGKYELRAGERRLRACRALKIKKIPAVVHTEMADPAALDLTYIENKFREDLKPMEEAAQVAYFAERLKGDYKAIAETIGKTERWVRLRANIHENLAACWREIFNNLDKHREFAGWTAKHLTQIARLPARRQEILCEEIKDFCHEDPEFISANELQRIIARELKLLSKASWDLEDVTLVPEAGACLKCAKRSGYNPILWDDPEENVDAGDRCLDGDCFGAKQIALLQRQAKEHKEKHGDIVFISKDYPENSNEIEANLGEYLRDHQFKTVPKTIKGAKPAMYVSGKSAGHLTYIKPVGSGETSRAAKPKGKVTPLKQRRAMLDAKRWAQVLIDLKEKVDKAQVTDITYKDKVTAIMALVAAFGNKMLLAKWPGEYSKIGRAEIFNLTKSSGRQARALEIIWRSFQPTLANLLTYNGPITQTPKNYVEDSKWIAEMIGVDIKALFKEVSARKGFTEPKAWKSLNADGTPKARNDQAEKTVKTKKTRKAKKAS